MKNLIVTNSLLFLFFSISLNAQNFRKTVWIIKAPIIEDVPNDELEGNAITARDTKTDTPEIEDKEPAYPTVTVRLVYENQAIYFWAYFFLNLLNYFGGGRYEKREG